MLQDDHTIQPLTYGRIASYYYLKHQTIRRFKEQLRAELTVHDLLSILTVSFILLSLMLLLLCPYVFDQCVWFFQKI